VHRFFESLSVFLLNIKASSSKAACIDAKVL
jgi:hypothetical protein